MISFGRSSLVAAVTSIGLFGCAPVRNDCASECKPESPLHQRHGDEVGDSGVPRDYEVVGWAALRGPPLLEEFPSGNFLTPDLALKARLQLPMPGQPVQGISEIVETANDKLLALSDNGFGARSNSSDYLLRIYQLSVSWGRDSETPIGSVDVRGSVILRDPLGLAGFPLVAELATFPRDTTQGPFPGLLSEIPVPEKMRAARWLTGADFDPESFVLAPDGTLWIGEEFGPFLLHFSAEGILLAPPIPIPSLENEPLVGITSPTDSQAEEITLVSPDHPRLRSLDTDQERLAVANHPRSRGIEAMSLSLDGRSLWILLEGPSKGGRQDRLVMCRFDLATRKFSDEVWFYQLDLEYQPKSVRDRTKVGALRAVSEREFLAIETDDGHGTRHSGAAPEKAAQIKRVYRFNLDRFDSQRFVTKQLEVDLLALRNPRGLGPRSVDGRLDSSFPFVTIESLWLTAAGELIVVSDNNYPSVSARSSSGSSTGETEFIFMRPLGVK